MDCTILHQVGYVRPAFIDFVDDLACNIMLGQPLCGATGGDNGKALFQQDTRGREHVFSLVHVLDRYERTPVAGQGVARPHLRLEECTGEIAVPSHDFAG